MKTIALLFAICSPATMPAEKPPCWWCKQTGTHVDVLRSLWFGRVMRVPCEACDGYGREVTLYGKLLKDRR